MNNDWDKLALKFNAHREAEEIDPGAADNMLIAWPVILDVISHHFTKSDGAKTALDYGCGTGGFAQKLGSLGFKATGADSSNGMLETAKQMLRDVDFVATDKIPPEVRYDLVTGIMVFQFIENIKEKLKELVGRLKPGGLFVFAIFNPKFVTSCLESKVIFSNFDSVEAPKLGTMNFGEGVSVPVYVREAQEYDAMLSELGMRKVMEANPPFTEEYLRRYPFSIPANEPEFLILAYTPRI